MVAFLCSCAAERPVLSNNWNRITENYLAVLYVNPDTVVANGSFRRLWEVQDLKERDRGGEMSRLAHTEYDCKNGRVRLLSYIEHANPMAKGAVLDSRKPFVKQWRFVPEGTPIYGVMREVCAS